MPTFTAFSAYSTDSLTPHGGFSFIDKKQISKSTFDQRQNTILNGKFSYKTDENFFVSDLKGSIKSIEYYSGLDPSGQPISNATKVFTINSAKFDYNTYDQIYSFTLKSNDKSNTSLENFYFSGNDKFIGSNFSDFIDLPILGKDKIFGNGGNDIIFSKSNTISVDAGSGKDLIKIQSSAAKITGGLDSDIFFIKNLGQKFIIQDFQFDDFLEVSLSEKPSNLRIDYIDNRGSISTENIVFGKNALDSNDFFVYDQKSKTLFFDSDGSGANEKQIIAKFKKSPFSSLDDLSDRLSIVIVGQNSNEGLAENYSMWIFEMNYGR